MDYDHLIADLQSGVLEIIFKKLDGSMRTMRCTLMKGLVPETHREDSTRNLTLDEMVIQYGNDVARWVFAAERGDLNSYPFKDILYAVFSVNQKEKVPEKSLLKVYDLGVRGWRSFHVNQVISSQFVETA
jgi:WYL_2, Sm-like SH3 beta-barrel fold